MRISSAASRRHPETTIAEIIAGETLISPKKLHLFSSWRTASRIITLTVSLFSGDGTTNEPTRKTSVMISQTIRKRVFSFFPMFLSPSFSCVLRQQSPAKLAAGI